jgi:hypothetical protein
MKGSLDIFSSSGDVSDGGTLWQCPAFGPLHQTVLLKKVVVLLPLALSKSGSLACVSSESQQYSISPVNSISS